MATPFHDFGSALAGDPHAIQHLLDFFDRLPDVVFSIKDREGRYRWFSQAGLERCGFSERSQVLGQRASDIFPAPMAARYESQDAHVFQTGEAIQGSLDLTLYPDRSPGWCLTHKTPMRNEKGDLTGLICMSRDLVEPDHAGLLSSRLAGVIDFINENYSQILRVDQLAEASGLSPAQFERRMKRVFQIGPAQYIIKKRIAAAMVLLEKGEANLAEIAYACGFSDQSAMSRQFKATTGLTPGQYRKRFNTPS